MNFETGYKKSIVAVAFMLLVMPVFQSAYAKTSQPLSLTATGGVTDLGNQKYAINGGQIVCVVCFAIITPPNGLPQIFAQSAKIGYQLAAQVTGLTVTGSAQFHLDGITTEGVKEVVDAKISIGDMVPAAVVGSSALPLFFLGSAVVQVTTGGSTQTFPTMIEMENPYFNPFGNPIIVGSTDSSVAIVMTYSQATIQWAGTVIMGTVSGTLGASTAVSGFMSLVSSENEDLVKGTAVDHGAFSFTKMTQSNLDVSGEYHGSSVIPAGGPDCTPTGLPPGTVTQTGFQSVGQFTTHNDVHVHIDGTYAIQWSVSAPCVPALGFGSPIPNVFAQVTES